MVDDRSELDVVTGTDVEEVEEVLEDDALVKVELGVDEWLLDGDAPVGRMAGRERPPGLSFSARLIWISTAWL